MAWPLPLPNSAAAVVLSAALPASVESPEAVVFAVVAVSRPPVSVGLPLSAGS